MKRKTKRKKIQKRTSGTPLTRAYEELDRATRTLIQTDLKLHQANDRLSRQIAERNALHRASTFINSTFDIEVIMQSVAELMSKDLDFEKTGIVFLDPKGVKPMQSCYFGFTTAEYKHLLEHYEALIHPALKSEEEVCLFTASYSQELWAKLLRTLSLTSLLILPMRFKSKLIGFMVAGRAHTTLRLSDLERRFYAMYSAQIASAIENARLYEALGQVNLTLEEKVHERTRNLIEANERLRELDTAKSNFISLISHELRTPLTAIKGFVMMLFHHDKDISEEKRKIYLNVLNEETDRLTRLITELLDISRIESGHIDFKWNTLSVPELVKKVIEKMAVSAKGIQFVMEFPSQFPEIKADSDKLEQVLINLLVNAQRFSPVGGVVKVRAWKESDGIMMEVSDEGMGIPFSEQEKIFDKFYRLDNDINRKNPGTGLGLSICRALVNLHGGKIWVESESGQGCRFSVSLPLNLDKVSTERPAAETTAEDNPPKRFLESA